MVYVYTPPRGQQRASTCRWPLVSCVGVCDLDMRGGSTGASLSVGQDIVKTAEGFAVLVAGDAGFAIAEPGLAGAADWAWVGCGSGGGSGSGVRKRTLANLLIGYFWVHLLHGWYCSGCTGG